MRDTVVYLGPTLTVAAARAILDAVYLAPIRRGDLAQLSADIRRIGIIDGEFYQSLAVSPKEIVPLLERGVEVYGASSMGALRAVELDSLGMAGVGRIFEAYRDGMIDAEDEVALTYDPESFRPLSAPLINVRFALQDAVRQGLIAPSIASEVLEKVRTVYFPERSWSMVIQICPELGPWLAQHRPDQKAEDARQLLRLLAGDSGWFPPVVPKQ